MKNYSKLLFLLITVLLVYWGCEEPVEQGDQSTPLIDTRPNSLNNLGDNSSYFYDFGENFNIKFYRWNRLSLSNNLLNEEKDTINFRNYKNYLLTIDPDSSEYESLTELVIVSLGDTSNGIPIDEELQHLKPENISVDSIYNLYQNNGFIQSIEIDTIEIYSSSFKNIKSLIWNEFGEIDPQFQNYSIDKSGYILDTAYVPHQDTVISRFYRSGIVGSDTVPVYVDPFEWVDQMTQFSPKDDEGNVILDTLFSPEFIFSRTKLSGDSLIYRQNTDCNDNGVWDSAEEVITGITSEGDCAETWGVNSDADSLCFVDRGNNIWDPAEPYIDLDSQGNPLSGYQDRNCNGMWDTAELKASDGITQSLCEDSLKGYWSVNNEDGFSFCDVGNGIWDDSEFVTEVHVDSDTTYDELFMFGSISKNLLVTWEADTARILKTVFPAENFTDVDDDGVFTAGTDELEDLDGDGVYDLVGDSLVARWPKDNPIIFHDIIERYEYKSISSKTVSNLDSVVSIWSHPVVENIDQGGDYHITKTIWEKEPMGPSGRKYDYHFFKNDDDHIYLRVFPSYFLHYGFFNNGFFQDSSRFVDEILFFTPGKQFRDGERIEEQETVVTSRGTYFIERFYSVDAADATLTPVGGESSGEFFSMDSCLKVTSEIRMTMLGNAVEYSEKNEIWLVKEKGVVKDQVSFHWSDPPDFLGIEGVGWVLYSKWELAENRPVNRSYKTLVNSNLTNLEQLGELEIFNQDPYQMKRKVGLHRFEFFNE